MLPTSGAPSPPAAVLWVVATEVWDLGQCQPVPPCAIHRRPEGTRPRPPPTPYRAALSEKHVLAPARAWQPPPGLSRPLCVCVSTVASEREQKSKSFLNLASTGVPRVPPLMCVGAHGAEPLCVTSKGTCWASKLQAPGVLGNHARGVRVTSSHFSSSSGFLSFGPSCLPTPSTLGRVFPSGQLIKGHFNHKTTVQGIKNSQREHVFTRLFSSYKSLVGAPGSASGPGLQVPPSFSLRDQQRGSLENFGLSTTWGVSLAAPSCR